MKDSYIFYKNQLGKEYLSVFEQIELYVATQNIDEAAREEHLGELLDIFISAEQAGKSVKSITGNHIGRFCRDFCSSFHIKNRIFHVLDYLKSLAWFLLVVSLLELLIPDTENGEGLDFLHTISSLNISGYFTGLALSLLLALLVNFIIRQIMFRTKRISMKILKIITVLSAFTGFVIICFFTMVNETNLLSCPVWILLAISGLYLILYYLSQQKRIAQQKTAHVTFRHMVYEEINKNFSQEMEKKFEKASRRSIKKGNGPLSLEAFLDKEEKICNLAEKTRFFYYLFPLLVIVIAWYVTYLTSGFPTLFDAILFVTILLAVTYPITISLRKLEKCGISIRKAWIMEKRKDILHL